jgi:putative transposase
VDTSLPAVRVVQVLERVAQERGVPEAIQVDNGPEFISRAVDQWAYARGVALHFIDPCKPVQNAFIESFNGSFATNA